MITSQWSNTKRQSETNRTLQVSHPAIEPLGECKSNVDFFRELALRMGFQDECFREPVAE